ncbi:hypothetical protein, partial [Morganella morganii]|uniref:hypothetical protein n=1 Tax=Morganella morganii TaxID=582 RepID=UPI001954CA45
GARSSIALAMGSGEFWQDYIVEAQVRMLSTLPSAHAGRMFRYVHARSCYALLLHDKKLKLE